MATGKQQSRGEDARSARRERIARRKGRGAGVGGKPVRKRPVMRAILMFSAVMGGYYTFDYFYLQDSGMLDWYLSGIASVTSGIIQMFGEEAQNIGTTIRSPGFSVRIVRGCDALDPTAAFVAAVLASPVGWSLKLYGTIVGSVALLSINLFRIVSLFFIGTHFREVFDMMHYEIWQAVFIVLAIVFWAIWVQWASRRRSRAIHATA